ncbi:MAG: membrane protein insertase YidC [Myxococcales bacterium]|nr:membrane protein insertase YidC [Myxococcales bacterium]
MKDEKERRMFTFVAVSLAIVWVWQFLFAPPPPIEAPVVPAVVASTAAEPAPAPPMEGVLPAAEATCTGKTATTTGGTAQLEVSDCGAVRSVRFPGVKAPQTVTGWWSWAWESVSGGSPGRWQAYAGGEGELDLLSGGELLVAGRGPLALGGTWVVSGADPLVQERTTADGFRVRRTVTRGASADLWDVTIRMESDRPLLGPFWVGVADRLSAVSAYSSASSLVAVVDGDLEQLTDPASVLRTTDLEGPVGWFGTGDRFFLAAIAPTDATGARVQWARVDSERVGAFYMLPAESIAPGTAIETTYTLYAGPRELGRLETAGHGFSEAVSLGIFGLFAKFLLITLHLIHDAIGSWGPAILALTLLVRLVTYPLTRAAVVSGRRMQALQPLMKGLQAKYADDKETLNREMMALYSKHGVNPVGGCFPMLIQMPVFFALFTALQYEPSLYNAQFLYLRDLSAQDPYGILSLFVMAGMYVQQMMMPTVGMDPTQAQMMKFMPLLFGFLMWSSPSGLALYYSLNTVLAILQQWYNTRSIPLVALDGDGNVAA